jgi:hypothetical protein
MQARSRAGNLLENFVVIVIILVLIQTFLEDFAIVAGWEWDLRRTLIFSGFCFDLFFTIEFLIRLFYAVLDGKVNDYIFHRRGWIDFLASIPLLLLNSGPAVAAILLGGGAALGMGGFLNVLKVVKAIRIARILRLLRVLKIFKQIKYADSRMAQRHIATITAISITTLVLMVFLFGILSPITGLPSIEKTYQRDFTTSFSMIRTNLEEDRPRTAGFIAENSPELMIYKMGDETFFSRYEDEAYREDFGPNDYSYIQQGNHTAFYDMRPVHELQSKYNLLFFVIVIALVVMLLVYYCPHFAITVTDPIHVMRRGMEDDSYNLEVKVPERYEDDDIFQLASLYNEVYLPLKDRNTAETGGGIADLKMDDIQDLLEEEEK